MNKDEAVLRIYEIGAHIVPQLGDEGANEVYEALKAKIVDFGGEIIQEGTMERIDLAYPISQTRENKKVNYFESYFIWIKFEIDASFAKKIETILFEDQSIMRHLMFKTVRQNTYIPRKSKQKKNPGEKVDILPDPEVILDEDPLLDDIEETPSILDKKLDELSLNDLE